MLETVAAFLLGAVCILCSIPVWLFVQFRYWWHTPSPATAAFADSLVRSTTEYAEHTGIIVVGPYGSGKTTTTKRLASLIQAAHIDSDSVYTPVANQPPISKTDCTEKLTQWISEQHANSSSWCMDLNYFFAMPTVLPFATHLVWIHIPWVVMFQRLVFRHFVRCCFCTPGYEWETFVKAFGIWRTDSYLGWQWHVTTKYNQEMERRFKTECSETCRLLDVQDPCQIEDLCAHLWCDPQLRPHYE
eukprot:TRINITY_DN31093_c0_g1_i1.p1 TRINITY_DN31093_c0_g1~~TRINITY_DN31093_c0_g1_i1.p1  ORF type:complete len:254 (+),score=3.16 TRINITY_DN31093_c0_g1_i1:30-764(+)